MKTITIAENQRGGLYPSATLASHIYSITSKEFVNADGATSITVTPPTFAVKYNTSANGRAYLSDYIGFTVSAGGVSLGRLEYLTGTIRLAANTNKSLSPRVSTLSSKALSTLFNANNPTVGSIPITWTVESGAGTIGISTMNSAGEVIGYRQTLPVLSVSEGSIKLNAPPTFTAPTMTKDTPVYIAGVTNVSVNVADAVAQYGGNITDITLTVGGQSVSRSDNGTLSLLLLNAGTFTPTITVTDSRGQKTSKDLADITVNAYNAPSVVHDVYRAAINGVKEDEGHYGLIEANISYTYSVTHILEPSVYIGGIRTNNVTWYASYSESSGVSNEILDWSNVASGAKVYGLISEYFLDASVYPITIIAEDEYRQSVAITQTLPVSFFTIDIQAGGKEIVFGAPAYDNLTNHENGLFKCNMDFNMSLDTDSSTSLDTILYNAIVAKGWANDVIETDSSSTPTVNILALLAKLTSN